jgi:acyl-CoA synthetase (AMP-forming)/AMP-acid ligase II
MLAHGSVVRNAYIVGRNFGLDHTGSVFSAGPFFHSGGLTMHVVLAALSGVPAYSVPAFDPDTVLGFVERMRPAIYNGIETLFLRLTDTPRFDRRRVASIRTGWATGTPAILHTIADEVGIPGVIGVYGISEASPNVTISPWQDTREHRLDTVGRPQPWTRAAIWDAERHDLAGPGTVGELIVRGYGLMQGYYRKPEETADALRGGWLHTGDLARIRPDGYLEFAGRAKDVVRMGGENISCAEVENAIYALGGAELAAVLPVDDPRYGQVPVAVVKPAGPAPPEDELLARLRANLASYKVPRRVLFLDELPLTESGKVRKDQLRATVLPLLGEGT